jgi:hypothetical protein
MSLPHFLHNLYHIQILFECKMDTAINFKTFQLLGNELKIPQNKEN